MRNRNHDVMIYMIGAMLLMMILVSFSSTSCSEEAWVICQPDSFVYVRSSASFGAEPVAYVEVGDKLEKDGRRHGDWVYVEFNCEAGGGWIFRGYLTNSEPEIYPEGIAAETDAGKVKARRYVKGPVRKTLDKGAQVMVYAVSDEWAITNLGFIMTKFLLFQGG